MSMGICIWENVYFNFEVVMTLIRLTGYSYSIDRQESITWLTRSKNDLDRNLDYNLDSISIAFQKMYLFNTGHSLYNTTKCITSLLFIIQSLLYHNPPNIWIKIRRDPDRVYTQDENISIQITIYIAIWMILLRVNGVDVTYPVRFRQN